MKQQNTNQTPNKPLHNHSFVHWLLLCAMVVLFCTPVLADTALNTPLDADNPVYFYGDTIQYNGETITLGQKSIYIDATLSDDICEQYDYVYNDFVEAYNSGGFVNGTADAPMNVYIAPYVYWIDDPDDEAIREGINGDPVPYGLWINCSYLSLNGLTDNPDNVVLAVNRGQSNGAKGNFTMFYINGNGTHTENITFGNYCCVDLEYPLKPELNREKRTTAITQSQLILTNGDKITAKNCNFISRLNSCPFVGGTRIFFEDCHFECTDDSLPTSAVYMNCNFEFYSSKPFYSTSGTGSVFLGCNFDIMHGSDQWLTKAGGVVTIIDGTFNSTKKEQYIGWTPAPANSLRCYSANITVNYTYTDEDGKEQKETINNYQMDADAPYDNVDITGKDALNAYRIESGDKVIYNVYNLLKGSDDWDPLGQKAAIAALSPEGKDYTNLPTVLSCTPISATITNGKTTSVSTSTNGFSSGTSTNEKITWVMEESLKDYITLTDNGDGTCSLKCSNTSIFPAKGMVYAYGESGLASGVYVTATPETQPAPTFVKVPTLNLKDGVYTLNYTLPNSDILEDNSNISWYRCSDSKGEDGILVAVSTNSIPTQQYTLTQDDIGYYIKAVIRPKQQNTYIGSAVTVISSKIITLSDVKAAKYHMYTDFSTFATTRQSLILPGFWTRDTYKAWLDDPAARPTTLIGWTYGAGAAGYQTEDLYGLLTAQKGARLMYTPLEGTYGDMHVSWVINTEKSAGQGFGGAGNYMDLFIKYDSTTLSGYALRLERISAYSNAVQAALVEYKNEEVTYISEKVITSAFNSVCTITLDVTDNKFTATVTTTRSQNEAQAEAGHLHSVNLEADITPTTHGGLGVIFVGSVPAGNRVMFNELDVTWKESEVQVDYEKVTSQNLGTAWSISNALISYATTATYTGKAITPAVTLTHEGNKLVQNKDYTVTYSNNVKSGTATITITGMGNYTGTITKSFTIKAAAVSKPQNNTTSIKVGTTFTSGDLKFKITNNNTNGTGTVTVIGTKNKNIKTVKIGATVSYNGVTYKITAIGKKAFANCKKLKSVTIGTNVKEIGANAFKNCSKLKQITISSKVLKKVGKNAFKGIAKKCKIKVPKAKLKKYKNLLKNKGQKKTVKITK